MKAHLFFLLLNFLSFIVPIENECLKGYYKDAAYDLSHANYQEAITSYQEAIQNCQLTAKEKKETLEKLSGVYKIINQVINEEREAALGAKEVAEIAENQAKTNEKRAVWEALQSEARRLALLADREQDNKQLKLKLAYEAMVLMDSSRKKLPNILHTFGDAVRDSFLTILPKVGGQISKMLLVEDKIILAKGKSLIYYQDSLIRSFTAHDDYILSLEQLGDNIISFSKDGNLKAWDKNGLPIFVTKQHAGKINFFRKGIQENLFLTGGIDNMAYLSQKTGGLINKMTHTASVVDGGFSIDGQRIFTRSQDHKVHIWKNKLIKEITADAYIYDATFLGKKNYFLTADAGGNIKKYDKDGVLISTYLDNKNPAIELHTSSDGNFFLGVFADGSGIFGQVNSEEIKEYMISDLNTKPKLEQWIPFKKVAFSPTTPSFLISANNEVQLLNFNGNIITSFQQVATVTDVAFIAEGQAILTTATDFSIKIHNIKGQLLIDINKLSSPVLAAQITPNNQKIIAYTQNGTLAICPLPETIFKKLKNNPPKWTRIEIDKFQLNHLIKDNGF